MHRARARLLPGERLSDIVEIPDVHFSPVGPPQVEGLAEEPSILFRGNREWQGQPEPVEFGKRDVLDIIDAQRAEEFVDLAGFGHVRLAEDAQRIEFHAVLLEAFDSLHDLPPGAGTLFVEAVQVMDRLRAVNGYAQQPFVLLE